MLWLVLGLIIGAGAYWLAQWARNKKTAIKWYEWLIGAIGMALILWGIGNGIASAAEYEARAAIWAPLLFGVPGLILIAAAWLRFWSRANKANKAQGQATQVAG